MEWISNFLNTLLSPETGGTNLWEAALSVLIAYLGGILSSLTPCVYPMIPITVSVVGGVPVGGPSPKSWRRLMLRSLSYIAGMTVIYSFLGVAAGLTGRIFGSFTNTPGWYLGLGVIMTLASLIMLEIIPFDPTVWWTQIKLKFTRKHKKMPHAQPLAQHESVTLWGAFFLGASSGFIAAPCTTPVLTSILAYIAKTQSIGLGFSLMTAFSLGLGTLLLLIALFAGAFQILPRSGKWLKAVKIGSGLILLAFAEYLIFRAGSLGGL